MATSFFPSPSCKFEQIGKVTAKELLSRQRFSLYSDSKALVRGGEVNIRHGGLRKITISFCKRDVRSHLLLCKRNKDRMV